MRTGLEDRAGGQDWRTGMVTKAVRYDRAEGQL